MTAAAAAAAAAACGTHCDGGQNHHASMQADLMMFGCNSLR